MTYNILSIVCRALDTQPIPCMEFLKQLDDDSMMPSFVSYESDRHVGCFWLIFIVLIYNLPKNDMHANPKNDMHANPKSEMHANPKNDMHAIPTLL